MTKKACSSGGSGPPEETVVGDLWLPLWGVPDYISMYSK